MGYMGYQDNDFEKCKDKQKHVHELQGSVMIAEREEDPHNHRFCTVTGEAIPCMGNEHDHVHEVVFRTDFYEDHFHEFRGMTGGAIPVGNRHVHFIESVTSEEECHRHCFEAATLIENPIEKEHKKEEHCCDKDHMHNHKDDHKNDHDNGHMYDNIHNNVHDHKRRNNNYRR